MAGGFEEIMDENREINVGFRDGGIEVCCIIWRGAFWIMLLSGGCLLFFKLLTE